MRVVAGVVLAAATLVLLPAQARAQARGPRTGALDLGVPAGARYSLVGGETLPQGVDAISAELGWPGISFGVTHGTGPNTDVGVRFDLLFGVEETTTFNKFGVGLRVPLRLVALRRDRVSVALHFDPGIVTHTYSPAWFGLRFPIGATIGYRAAQNVTLAFGIDAPMTLFLTPSPVAFWIAPMFGPSAEIQVTRELLAGVNMRFGPVIRSAIPSVSFVDTSGSEFGFLVQLLLAYRM